MSWAVFVEWFGVLSSVLVAVSLTMKNIKWLRIMNLIGSFCFAVYGFCIVSFPVMILNVFTVGVNIFYLIRMQKDYRKPSVFDVIAVDPKQDEYVRRFLRFSNDDIRRFFPSYNSDPETGTLAGAECCFILRETLPVSLVAFRREKDNEIAILLDYAVPAYRDLKNARFFFETAATSIAPKGSVFTAAAEVPAHESYLRRIGFTEIGRTGSAVLFRKEV
ncbi:YgjV family protein [Breznakiella homolactica]|uniref:YgjV family protein n=1 Tax=Breznakiella homolactica TaxID=2798577 RepID=A0A7T8BA31_9SPIR|nr:YgjV family protein [Breznakiella homolactica]QQO09107.1 YgjV family protein [Breznakiella homolactica]